MAQVFWAARDLDGWNLGGNHSFILIYLNQNESLLRTKAESEGGTKFAILAGHQVSGNLVFVANQTADVQCVREVLNPSLAGYWDFDMEEKRITPPSGSGWSFAIKLEELAWKYAINTSSKAQEYGLLNFNCATWVNTMLTVAGVSQYERMKLGEFSGIDWGEEDLLDKSLFK
jgi:hypothetical protein